MTGERWVVAMSGGVDSSVAAALLAREGREVIGITMDLGGAPADAEERGFKSCCGLPEAEDARAVARALGVKHYTANYHDEFREHVIEPFVSDYAAGRTPIPCIACNRVLKFDVLLRRARQLGARGVATGHYARIAPGPDGTPALFRARDRDKDQSYFLFDVPRGVLPQLSFPVGELSKAQVRDVARELGLCTADKPESQGICFVPDGNVRAALTRLRPTLQREPGPIVDEAGGTLGEHTGALGYTLGQRSGLGLAGGPWYVVEVRVRENTLVVARRHALLRFVLALEATTWSDGVAPKGPVRVQIRHRQRAAAARVEDAHIHFEAPVWAPAPGQAAVVYDVDDERVLGGGWIGAAR